MGRSLVNGFTTGSIMSHISLLAFTVLLCFIAVQAEDSQELQLSNSISDLPNLKRDVRSPDGNPKKKVKKRKGNGHGRDKTLILEINQNLRKGSLNLGGKLKRIPRK